MTEDSVAANLGHDNNNDRRRSEDVFPARWTQPALVESSSKQADHAKMHPAIVGNIIIGP